MAADRFQPGGAARWVAALGILGLLALAAALLLFLATASIYAEVDEVFRSATTELTDEQYLAVNLRYTQAGTLRGLAPHVATVGLVAVFAAMTAAGRLWDRRRAG